MRKAVNLRLIGILAVIFLLPLAAGCAEKPAEPQKLKDLEFTVLKEGNVPQEFLDSINKAKASSFTMTYTNDGYLYIAKGYGTQRSGGYSIRVMQLFEADTGIFFESELLGPGKDEPVLPAETHPYIVVKLKDIGKEVTFLE